MAENATPTFKLVLVGDGGTGKVRTPRMEDHEAKLAWSGN